MMRRSAVRAGTPLLLLRQTAAAPTRSLVTSRTVAADPSAFVRTSRHIPPARPLPPRRSRTWLFVGGAVAAVFVFGVADWVWQRSDQKAALDRRSSKPGFALPMLLALREARVTQQEAEQQVAACEERMEAQARRRHKAHKREGRGDSATPRMANPFTRNGTSNGSDAATALPADVAAILSQSVPALLLAESQYRLVLSQHLSFTGLELGALHAAVAQGSPTPAQQAVGQRVDPATRRDAQRAIDAALNTAPGVDASVLPHVLSLLGHNLQQQARVLKLLAEEEVETRTDIRDSKGTIDSSLASAAAQRFRASERCYLQSLTLYRHHFAFSPRPYAAEVLRALGSLYFDAGEAVQAEQVLIHSLNMLSAASKALHKWGDKQQSRADELAIDATGSATTSSSSGSRASQLPVQSELNEPATFARIAAISSHVCEQLALLHRSRGRYEQAAQWDREALARWDEHCSEQMRGASTSTVASPAPPPSPSGAPAPSPALVQALSSLPRALHLLSALTADLAVSTGAEGSAARAQQRDAYATALQGMQVLQRIVALQQKARGIKRPADVAQDPDDVAASQASAHAVFLSSSFTEQLREVLRVGEEDARAAAEALLRAQVSSANFSAGQQKQKGAASAGANNVAVPLEPFDARVRELRAEAAAAYTNLAKLLKSQATAVADHAKATALQADAQKATSIAKQIRRGDSVVSAAQ